MTTMAMPQGSVTMAFTDIEGSTKLLQRVGDRWSAILGAHHAAIRAALQAHDGYEVDTAGDGFFVSFARASDAVRFALDAQRALATDPVLAPEKIKVRMGLHAGEVEVSAGAYLGLAVHHAARIASAANGGQVLVSETTRALAGDATEVEFIDLGEHELKDLARPVRLYQLAHTELNREFAPVRSLNRAADTLPVTRSSFVGRDGDVATLRAALEAPGLVTLTGPGGCGKTRLAVEAARSALDILPGGAWFVDLRTASSGDQIDEFVAAAVGVDSRDSLVAKLRREPALVVLDNCEHLVAPCADLAEALLNDCPELRMIATSRDLLGIDAEVARRVPPLAAEHSVALFADRARRVQAGFALDDKTAEVVGRICVRLDGIPLAIELAAARVRHMTADALEGRLDDMFRVLVGSDRRAVQRHQTLEAVIDWSYQLLDPDEQAVVRRLAVFAGGFDLDAAAAVCDVDDASDIVFRLVDRSLVERGDADRYQLLETIRAFGQARLRDEGESDDARHRHLDHFVALAERLGPEIRGAGFFDAVDRAEVDFDNLREAIEWTLGGDNIAGGLRILTELALFFTMNGHAAVVDSIGNEALALAERVGLPVLIRARALAGLGLADMAPGNAAASIAYAGEAVALYDTLEPADRDEFYGWVLAVYALEATFVGSVDDAMARASVAMTECAARGWEAPRALAQACNAMATSRRGDMTAARAELALAVAALRSLGGGVLLTLTLFWSGMVSMHAHDFVVGRGFYEEAIPMARRLAFKLWLQWMLDHVAQASIRLGDLAAARAYSEEGLAASRQSGLVGFGNYASLLANLAVIEERLGDLDQAAMYREETVEITRHLYEDQQRARLALVPELARLAEVRVLLGQRDAAAAKLSEALDLLDGLEAMEIESLSIRHPAVSPVLTAIALVASHDGREPEAAELYGAASAYLVEIGEPLDEHDAAKLASRTDELRAALGDDAFGAALARGEQMPDRLARARVVLADDRPRSTS